MPQLNGSQALTANQLGFNPFSGWQYEYVPFPSQVKVLVRATGLSGRITLYTGSETIQERSPIQGGGTAGVTPSELNTAPIIFEAAQGDRLKAAIDEVSGLTPTVDFIIILEPL
jgi:hypothetical protein